MPRTERHDFSIAWGCSALKATKTLRIFKSDDEAKGARDAFAAAMRKEGYKVRLSSFRNQRREYWGWQEPCGITCNVYCADVEINDERQLAAGRVLDAKTQRAA